MKPYIEKIYDYTQEKMFDDVLIKSAIMILNKKQFLQKCLVTPA